MKSTKLLSREHRLILTALDHLETARRALERDLRPPAELFTRAVQFFRNFADRFHHFKEEYLMFGLLAEKRDGEMDLAIGVLRHEHERCREHIQAMEDAIPGYAHGEEIATITLLENLAAYISLLRRHIHKEEHTFFPLVERSLSEPEDRDLHRRFRSEAEGAGGPNGGDALSRYGEAVSEMGAMLEGM